MAIRSLDDLILPGDENTSAGRRRMVTLFPVSGGVGRYTDMAPASPSGVSASHATQVVRLLLFASVILGSSASRTGTPVAAHPSSTSISHAIMTVRAPESVVSVSGVSGSTGHAFNLRAPLYEQNIGGLSASRATLRLPVRVSASSGRSGVSATTAIGATKSLLRAGVTGVSSSSSLEVTRLGLVAAISGVSGSRGGTIFRPGTLSGTSRANLTPSNLRQLPPRTVSSVSASANTRFSIKIPLHAGIISGISASDEYLHLRPSLVGSVSASAAIATRKSAASPGTPSGTSASSAHLTDLIQLAGTAHAGPSASTSALRSLRSLGTAHAASVSSSSATYNKFVVYSPSIGSVSASASRAALRASISASASGVSASRAGTRMAAQIRSATSTSAGYLARSVNLHASAVSGVSASSGIPRIGQSLGTTTSSGVSASRDGTRIRALSSPHAASASASSLGYKRGLPAGILSGVSASRSGAPLSGAAASGTSSTHAFLSNRRGLAASISSTSSSSAIYNRRVVLSYALSGASASRTGTLLHASVFASVSTVSANLTRLVALHASAAAGASASRTGTALLGTARSGVSASVSTVARLTLLHAFARTVVSSSAASATVKLPLHASAVSGSGASRAGTVLTAATRAATASSSAYLTRLSNLGTAHVSGSSSSRTGAPLSTAHASGASAASVSSYTRRVGLGAAPSGSSASAASDRRKVSLVASVSGVSASVNGRSFAASIAYAISDSHAVAVVKLTIRLSASGASGSRMGTRLRALALSGVSNTRATGAAKVAQAASPSCASASSAYLAAKLPLSPASTVSGRSASRVGTMLRAPGSSCSSASSSALRIAQALPVARASGSSASRTGTSLPSGIPRGVSRSDIAIVAVRARLRASLSGIGASGPMYLATKVGFSARIVSGASASKVGTALARVRVASGVSASSMIVVVKMALSRATVAGYSGSRDGTRLSSIAAFGTSSASPAGYRVKASSSAAASGASASSAVIRATYPLRQVAIALGVSASRDGTRLPDRILASSSSSLMSMRLGAHLIQVGTVRGQSASAKDGHLFSFTPIRGTGSSSISSGRVKGRAFALARGVSTSSAAYMAKSSSLSILAKGTSSFHWGLSLPRAASSAASASFAAMMVEAGFRAAMLGVSGSSGGTRLSPVRASSASASSLTPNSRVSLPKQVIRVFSSDQSYLTNHIPLIASAISGVGGSHNGRLLSPASASGYSRSTASGTIPVALRVHMPVYTPPFPLPTSYLSYLAASSASASTARSTARLIGATIAGASGSSGSVTQLVRVVQSGTITGIAASSVSGGRIKLSLMARSTGVTASSAARGSVLARLIAATIGISASEVTIMPTARLVPLTGKLVDTRGAPVAGVGMRALLNMDPQSTIAYVPDELSVVPLAVASTTALDGTFTLRLVAPGDLNVANLSYVVSATGPVSFSAPTGSFAYQSANLPLSSLLASPAPPSDTYCTVSGYVVDPSGMPVAGAYVAVGTTQEAVSLAGTPVDASAPVLAASDADGFWSVRVIPTTSLLPANTYYTVSEGAGTPRIISVGPSGGYANALVVNVRAAHLVPLGAASVAVDSVENQSDDAIDQYATMLATLDRIRAVLAAHSGLTWHDAPASVRIGLVSPQSGSMAATGVVYPQSALLDAGDLSAGSMHVAGILNVHGTLAAGNTIPAGAYTVYTTPHGRQAFLGSNFL